MVVAGSYTIQNLRSCPVTFHYEVGDCTTLICGSTVTSPITLAPGANYIISSPCATTGYDIFVWVLEINGVDVTHGGSNANSVCASGGNCFWSGSGTTFSGPATGASCGPLLYNVNCGPAFTTIN